MAEQKGSNTEPKNACPSCGKAFENSKKSCKNTFLKYWLPDIRKSWIPAIITGILGGFIISFAVPWANSLFEQQRLYQERKTRLLESTAEIFTGVVANTGKIRALEEAITQAKNDLNNPKILLENKTEIEKYINNRSQELRETEVLLYSQYQKLYANFALSELLFSKEIKKIIENYKEWYENKGDVPIQAKELSIHLKKLIGAMVKEMEK